jgi:hypothetical protein
MFFVAGLLRKSDAGPIHPVRMRNPRKNHDGLTEAVITLPSS